MFQNFANSGRKVRAREVHFGLVSVSWKKPFKRREDLIFLLRLGDRFFNLFVKALLKLRDPRLRQAVLLKSLVSRGNGKLSFTEFAILINFVSFPFRIRLAQILIHSATVCRKKAGLGDVIPELELLLPFHGHGSLSQYGHVQ